MLKLKIDVAIGILMHLRLDNWYLTCWRHHWVDGRRLNLLLLLRLLLLLCQLLLLRWLLLLHLLLLLSWLRIRNLGVVLLIHVGTDKSTCLLYTSDAADE